jgi:NADH:ubiquinone oxidoreductase subunit 6 (subunit J)
MVGVAACSGIAVGSALGLLIRRDRSFQLLALGLLSLALAAAFVLAGAPLPALGALLMGAFTEVVVLAPAARTPVEADEQDAQAESRHWAVTGVSALAALAVVGVLIGVGVASRSALTVSRVTLPTLAQVGHQLVMGTGVAVLVVGLLAATTVVGGAALIQRDPREAAEEQMEQARRRRLEAQRRRQAQREQARAAARAARRRSGR